MLKESVGDPSIHLDGLFVEFVTGSLRLRNRFVMAPMTRVKSPGGVPNSENIE